MVSASTIYCEQEEFYNSSDGLEEFNEPEIAAEGGAGNRGWPNKIGGP